ncbi:MAG: MarR family winged helix-turn-helix transcriptional regulator [Armatimonadota bacterium]|nr:MarR family winged helix-turn-helix transcriptional regulator [Armatimonadota bacterium]
MERAGVDAQGGRLSARVTTALAKIGIALKADAWRRTGRRVVTPTQRQILALLRFQGARVSDLAGRLGVTSATASEAVAALVRKGLVRKAASAADGRSRVVTLTPAGRREADRAAGWPDVLLGAVDVLAPAEQAVLLRALVKMIRTLQEQGRIPVSRMCVTCRFFRPHVHPDLARPHHCAFVDAPFGDRELRIECLDHEPADASQRSAAWAAFAAGGGEVAGGGHVAGGKPEGAGPAGGEPSAT